MKARFKDDGHGVMIWGLGYVSSEHEQDDDAYDYEEDEDHSRECCELSDLILTGKDKFDQSQMEQIANMDSLREAYNNRWYQDGD